MPDDRPISARNSWVPALAVGVVVALLGGTAWYFFSQDGQPANHDEISSEQETDIEQFYVGVAALEVEENQRGAGIFEKLSESLPKEPAVWANLTIARLRLNELPPAEQAARQAAELSPANDDIVVLQALVDERAGRIEQAVERLESVQKPDAATLYELAELLQRTGKPEAERQRLQVYERILKQVPGNMVVLFEWGRLAARLEDAAALKESLESISKFRDAWSPQIQDRYKLVNEAVQKGDFREAATQMAFLQNLNKPEAAYQQSLNVLGVSGQSVGRPFRSFLAIDREKVLVADSDLALRFEMDPDNQKAVRPDMFLAFPSSGERDSTLVSLAGDEFRIGTTAVLQFSQSVRSPDALPLGLRVLQSVDINSDFQEDIVCIGDNGLSIILQEKKTEFKQFEPVEEQRPLFERPGRAVWPLDYDADGDLDLLIATQDVSSRLLRNNGDMTFSEVDTFPQIASAKECLWMDFDRDGDGDVATLHGDGKVSVLWNDRGGKFLPPEELPFEGAAVAIAAGDPDQDGTFDVVLLTDEGHLVRLFVGADRKHWESKGLLMWSDPPDLKAAFEKQRVSLFLADLDNNGGIDITASAETSTAVWLNDLKQPFQRLSGVPDLFVTSVTDCNGDGRLDLAGMNDEAGVVAINEGRKDYHSQTILARATTNAGDSRINTFGIGGRISLRTGLLFQSAPITSARTHFGLGKHTRVGVARIVWPNGIVQAEFEFPADQALTAVQRLGTSCPFVFARGEDGFEFIKDFIWRSPLGLKINAQDTAGVSQTEDRIKIPGQMLTAKDGRYEVRITADLWETHFFDHVSLLVVDHPATTEIYLDERFMPTSTPDLSVQITDAPHPVRQPFDESGTNLDEPLRKIDGNYVDTFPLGKYQGVVPDHWVEFDLDEDIPQDGSAVLIGHGWIFPTNSSLNVAMSQGDFPPPYGLIIDVQDADGQWRQVSDDLGFPAGKNKDVLLRLPASELAKGLRHFRVRTNLEVYWDYLGWTVTRPSTQTTELPAKTLLSELRYRGYSEMTPADRRKPDLPIYERIASQGQRWLDLEGYYTRYGDVSELLRNIDDRYVIMNSGDELVFQFEALDAPPQGWKRDFVLIGDGWVKDGDLNTTFSKTVHPLPSHGAGEPTQYYESLFNDPVFQAHQEDWQTFHTRYVIPRHFYHSSRPASQVERNPGGH